MADWSAGIDSSPEHRVWFRNDRYVDEVPVLELDTSWDNRLEELSLERTLTGANRASPSLPPPPARSRRPVRRVPERRPRPEPRRLRVAPLIDAGPEIGERTPPTLDMGLPPDDLLADDEPTEPGHDPHSLFATVNSLREDDGVDDTATAETDWLLTSHKPMALADVIRRDARSIRASGQTTLGGELIPADPITPEVPLFPADPGSVGIDLEEVSLSLELDTAWLVAPMGEQQPGGSRTPEPVLRAHIPARLADRAPAPQVIGPLRSTVPSVFRSTHNELHLIARRPMSTILMDTAMFACGVTVGASAGLLVSFLALVVALIA